MHSRDTSQDARKAQLDALRSLGGAGRIAQVVDMSERAREIAIQGWLDRHPNATRAEAVADVRRRILGDELFNAAYPDGRVE